MEEKKTVKLKSKVDWKRVFKFSLISVALLLLVVMNVVSAVGGRDERADSGVVAYADTDNQFNSYVYVVLPSGTVFTPVDNTINSDARCYCNLSLSFTDMVSVSTFTYSYAICFDFGNISYNNNPFAVNCVLNGDGSFSLTEPYVIYFSSDFVQEYSLIDYSLLYINPAITISQAWITYNYNLSNFDYYLPAVYVNQYNVGYDSGYDTGYEDGYYNGVNWGLSQDLANPVTFILEPVNVFFSYELFGVISIGDLLSIALFVFLAIIFIKMFSGG